MLGKTCNRLVWLGTSVALVLVLGGCSAKGGSPEPQPEPPPPAPSHWSLIVPTRPSVPEVVKAEWPKNPIDHFVLQKLEASGLEPAPAAAAGRLLRRVTLDLTGLPPTSAELQAFSADPSDAAYSQLVDRLLDQPAFGEQRAHYWLDVARYADTHGYHFDNYRSIWPYREYVIRSFASNKPFDVFTTEQLAGDLLPDASVEQRTATGFIRAAMSTNEQGVDAERIRGHLCQGPGRYAGQCLARAHRRLRRLPRSSLRSDQAEGLLRADGILPKYDAARDG